VCNVKHFFALYWDQATPVLKKKTNMPPNLDPNLLQSILEKIAALGFLSVWILIELTK